MGLILKILSKHKEELFDEKVFVGCLALALLLSTAACGNDAASDPGSSGEPSQASSQETSEPKEVVEITYPTYRVGTNVLAETEAI